MKIKRTTRAFTLIELILYVAIVSVVMGALIPFVLEVVSGSAKNRVVGEVAANAGQLSERLKYEIRNSKGINTGSSNFGVNIVNGGQLSLVKEVPNNPTVISVVGGKVMITLGVGSSVALNSIDTKVTNLTFTDNSSGDNKTKNVGYVLTMEDNSSSLKQEYNSVISVEGAVEVRNNP